MTLHPDIIIIITIIKTFKREDYKVSSRTNLETVSRARHVRIKELLKA